HAILPEAGGETRLGEALAGEVQHGGMAIEALGSPCARRQLGDESAAAAGQLQDAAAPRAAMAPVHGLEKVRLPDAVLVEDDVVVERRVVPVEKLRGGHGEREGSGRRPNMEAGTENAKADPLGARAMGSDRAFDPRGRCL